MIWHKRNVQSRNELEIFTTVYEVMGEIKENTGGSMRRTGFEEGFLVESGVFLVHRHSFYLTVIWQH